MTATIERAKPASGVRTFLGRGGTTKGIYIVLGIVLLVSWVVVGNEFFLPTNVRNMLVRSVSLGIVSVGQTLVILAGSLDLSVAYLISLTTLLAGSLMAGDPSRIWLAVGVLMLVGVGVGLVNGLLITKLRAHPFIATLGTALIMRGLMSSAAGREVPAEFRFLGYTYVGPVPLSVILMAIVFAIAWFVLNKTKYGNHLYAVGGSQDVARLSGVRSDRTLIVAHVLCSVAAVITGLYLLSRRTTGSIDVGPQGGYDLESIAAVVVGGTSLAGGRGGVLGTLAGVLILAVLDNVFNALEVNSFLKQVLRGIIIVAAVASYALRSKREAEA